MELKRLHLAQLCDMDIPKWISLHSEVEVIDLVMQLREEIARQTPPKGLSPSRELLEGQVERLLFLLPPDLQAILRHT
ncbi:Protein dennd6b [Entomophthora muscae]|uniref:Protein dennd6b n=2 Tax=Entomophthora muscae TaxID=34485 RepID=A0ACC2RDV5_9FUNG|nr:Protein dennd6b [Entomophthora muscae]KAJ9051806.1 Protein dennd6b [Entomophthora muscae]